MQDNNRLVILTCLAIFLITLGWFTFVNISGLVGGQKNSQPLSIKPVETKETEREARPTPAPARPARTERPLPDAYTIPGGAHAFQTFNNCGPAALSMALSLGGINVSQQELGRAMRPYQHPQGNNDDKSVTLKEVAAKGEEYGLIAYHRPAGNVELLQQFVAAGMPVITRTWLNLGEDIGHYRVVKGYDKNAGVLIQDDSLQGANLRYTYTDYLNLWRDFNYEFVVLVPAEKIVLAEEILAAAGILDQNAAWLKALEIAERERAQNPASPFPEFNRSVALYYLGEFQDSISAFETVQTQLPGRMLWYQIEPILAYYRSGQNDDRVLQMTSQILNNHNRAFSELYFLRSQVFARRGDQELAAAELQKANQYNSSGSWKVNVEEICSFFCL